MKLSPKSFPSIHGLDGNDGISKKPLKNSRIELSGKYQERNAIKYPPFHGREFEEQGS